MRVLTAAKPLRQIPAAIVIAVILISLLLAASAGADDLPVTWQLLKAEPGYEAARVYGGTTAPARASELGFKQGGEIANIAVDIGDEVKRGDLLASLDSASLRANLANADAALAVARANLQAADADLDLAARTDKRFRDLRVDGHVSEQLFDETRLKLSASQARRSVAAASLAQARASKLSAEVALSEASIRAPFDGTVQSRYVDEGTQVTPGRSVLRLVDTTTIEAHVGIPEVVARNIDQAATYPVRWGEQRWLATFKALLPEIDPTTRTVTGVFTIEPVNSAHRYAIAYGAVVELELTSSIDEPGYWTPLAALTEADRGLWAVYVLGDENLVERRLVEVIHTEATRAFVRGTLQDGERMVTSDASRIVPGQRVTSAEQTLARSQP
ncbi:MAG: efflux RND transporter periplasmic adaptor subunit [Pseudomonadaceae bacterium]|nr:efflux RND transporter periplasmic adaptor subunit [Pseudomonadaceae bacterium]